MSSDAALRAIVAGGRLGVVATLKRDGRPQLSTVAYVSDPGITLIRASVTDGRAKTANLRRDPRVSIHVAANKGWSYAVAEGSAELGPVSAAPGDATADELVEIYRLQAGEHSDWDEFRAAMVADKRLVLRIHVERLYGLAR